MMPHHVYYDCLDMEGGYGEERIMSHLEEAEDLRGKIKAALAVFHHNQRYEEDEVMFRFGAIRGVLLMAQNDVAELCRVWEEQKEAGT